MNKPGGSPSAARQFRRAVTAVLERLHNRLAEADVGTSQPPAARDTSAYLSRASVQDQCQRFALLWPLEAGSALDLAQGKRRAEEVRRGRAAGRHRAGALAQHKLDSCSCLQDQAPGLPAQRA